MLNLDALSYLIGYFRQIKDTFGENSKSVFFFKQQTQNLVAIGQVGIDEVNFVIKLIGAENTDAVKWESSNKRVDAFNFSMSYLVRCQDEAQLLRTMAALEDAGKLDKDIKKLICNVYGIVSPSIPSINDNIEISFGSNNNLGRKGIRVEALSDTGTNSLLNKGNRAKIIELLKSKPSWYIEVANINRVCTGDPRSYMCKIGTIFNTENRRYSNVDDVAECILGGGEFKIGKLDPGDGCSGSRDSVIGDSNFKQTLMSLNFRKEFHRIVNYIAQENNKNKE